jgi:hypothetical protein
MTDMPSGLAAEIAGGASRHALCCRLTRADGVVIGVTEHDRTIIIGGVAFSPGAALDSAQFVARAGLAPDPASISGAFSSEAITEADLDAGLWNGAQVDVFRAAWGAGRDLEWDEVFRVWSGRLTGITRRGAAFEAELVSLKADLEAPVGRVIARRCDAVLGDERCGVDLSDPAFAGASCDKRLKTCVERFANAENFRGFPDLIGNDALIAGDTVNRSGGSRRRGLP